MTRRNAFAVQVVVGVVLTAAALVSNPVAQPRRRPGVTRVLETVNGRRAAAAEVLVKFRRPLAAFEQDQLDQQTDADQQDAIGSTGVRRLHSRRFTAQALLAFLRSHPDVEYAEPNYLIEADAVPNDGMFNQLWGLLNLGQVVGVAGTPGADISATSAWDITTGSTANVVAVIDTGIDYSHVDLSQNVWSAPATFNVTIGGQTITCDAGTHGFNAILKTCDPADDNGHGTHVSGTIGARGNNGIGVAGVNWTTRIMASKFLDANGVGTTADAINALEFVIQAAAATGANVRVLSNSWSSGGFSQALLDVINKANGKNMLFVASAGNNATSNDTTPRFPANYGAAPYNAPNVITVASTKSNDTLAGTSNFGASSVHLAAPGEIILSTVPFDIYGTEYQYFSGTSMAVPHVAGAAMLVLSRCALTTAQLKDDLLATVDPVPTLNGLVLTGGRLNVNAALRACIPDFSLTAPTATKTTPPGTSTDFGINVSSTGGFTGAVSFTLSGLPPGATASFNPASVTSPGSTLMTVAPNTSVAAGSYPLTITGTSGSISHTVGVTLVIGGTTTTTTVAGDTNPSIYGGSVTFTASVSASDVATGTVAFRDGATVLGSAPLDSSGRATFATSSLSAGTHAITAAYSGDGRFGGSTSAAVSQIVNKAALTVTADDKSRGYGDGNPPLTATIGGFRNNEALATSGVAGTPSLATTAVAGSATGSYPINVVAGTLASANYTFTFVAGSLTITKAALTVTADGKSRGYGDPNPALTATFTGFRNNETLSTSGVAGAPSLTTTAVAGSAVGTYPITAAAGTLASANYAFTFAGGTLTVNKAALTVTADSKSRGYGDANPALTATFVGFKNGETLATSGVTGAPNLTTTAAGSSAVGSYPITAGAGTLASANYTFTFVAGSMTVTKAALSVTADSQSRGYGDPNPTLTATFSGFRNGETLATSGVTGAPTLTTTAAAGSAPGSYPITVLAGNLVSANYTFTFVTGTLTINKAALIVTADHKSRLYGDVNPTLTASFNGFKNGETLATSGVTGTPGLTTTATASSGAGSYAIAVAAGTLASANYSFTFVSGSLTVSKAVLSIAADNQLRGYGDPNPSFTATYSGFRNSETLATSGVTGAPSLTTTAVGGSTVGSYPITVTVGTLASANYTFAFVNGSLQVTAAPLTVTADNKSRGYGSANPTLTASFSGFKNGETLATSGVTGAPNLTTTAGAASVVDSYPITVAAGALASTNYTFTFVSGSLSVTPAALTIAANDQTRSYGATNPALTVSYSGFVNGDTPASLATPPTVTTTATTASGVGTYPITASGAVSANANYTINYGSGTLTVTPAALTITATNKTRTYGAANPALTVSYNGFVNGDTPATLTTPPTVTTTATAASGAGTYPITASGAVSANANYTISYVSGTLTVTPASLTVTAANKTRTYGAANPAFTANFAGFLNGDTASSLGGTLTFSTAATTSSVVGTYPITPASLTSSNYTISYANGTLTVTAAVLTITANDQTRAYGATNPALTVSYSGFVNGDTPASLTTPPTITTSATTASGVGAYPITASGAASSNANYAITYASGTLTVTPAALTVTAGNKTRTYGAANPAFTASFAGFVNGDTAAALGGTLIVGTTATASSPVGTYAITPSGLTSTNYAITYVNGTLTVTPAVLTITANDQTRVYGAANPVLSVSYSGFVNGDTAASLTTPPTVTTTATAASGVGAYPITPSGAVSSNANYTISYASGTLTVTPAALTVTAANKTRTYGAANPAFTANVAGFVNGDTAASLGGTLTVSTTATTSSVVGTYAITPAGLTSSNYTISYVNGTLTVTSAVLTITANDQTKAYGAANPALTVSYSGFVNGDTAASLTTPPTVTTTATTASGVGTYPITASGAASANANYTITYVSGTLTVTPAALTVTASNKTRTYGAANPAFTASVAGFVAGDTVSSLGGTLTFSTTATASSAVGTYAITPAGLTSTNYTISYVNGTLTVTPAALAVTATNKTRTYGAPNPAFTASFSGLVGGDTVSSLGGTLTFSTTATTSSVVGTYAITPAGLTSTNYTISYVNATLTVTSAVLTISANDQTKAYGAANPALTVSYSGFVNGDTAASLTTPPTVTTTATTASGVGTYPITASGAASSNANYTITYASGTLTVTPTALTVTAANKTRTYGAGNPAFTANVAGFVNGDTVGSLGGTLVVNTAATANSPVGTYPITPSGLTSTNYTINYVNGTLTVTSAVLTITANDQTKAYGAANPALTVSYNGFVNGDTAASLTTPPTVTTTATTASGVGPYPITASGAASSNANYTITYASGTLTVTPAVLTVTAANKTRTYGAANPAFTASLAGFVNGDTTASLGGTLTFSTTATASSVVGTYAITPAGVTSTNYTISYVNGTLTVTSAVLTITANDQTRAYGAVNPALTVSYSGFVNGDTAASLTTPPTITTTATTASGVGPYPITASGAASSNANYTISYVNGTLTVTPVALTVTASNKTRSYGAANPAFTANVAGFLNGDTAASLGGTLTFTTTATASSAVGSYAITPSGLTSTNYAIAYADGTLTVTPAVLTVTAANKTRTYGAPNPAFTASFSGFVGGDTAASLGGTLTFSTTATTSSVVGTYAITPAGLTSTNYTISYVNATLTVTSAVLTISANDQTKAYGAANPALTVSYSGFVNGDTAASLTTPPTVTTTATTASGVGPYPITASGAVSSNANYTITYASGTLTVTPAVLTVTAANKTRTYGAANPAFTASVAGFVNGDTAASLGGTLLVNTTAVASSPVGTYAIAPSGLASTNYTISYVNGTLTVTSAVLAITANDQIRAYGALNPALTVSYSGFVNGDTAASLTTPPTVTTTATTASGVGPYPITASGAVSSNANYTITYASGTLTVTPAVLTITAANKTRTYGAANPAFTASVAGFVNGDTAASLGGTLLVNTTAVASSPVGTYAIAPSGLASTNYTISYVNGTLTVTSAVLAITANDQIRAYGALNPALTVSYSGFVNGDTAASLTTPPTVTTTATTASGVGTYPITASGAASANANYTITYASGTLTVTPAVLTITAANKTRTYGAANPAFTASVAGFLNGDTAASLTGTLTFSTTATASSAVGTYAITPGGLTSSNYAIAYADGTLTVTPAVLTVTAANKTRTYGAVNPAFTASFSGLVAGDTVSSLGGTLTFSTTATASSAVGTYAITPAGLTSTNYTISYVNGTLTVTSAVLTITANDQTKAYGAANPALTVSYSGFVNGDTAASLTTPPTVTTTATTASGVGPYPITASGAVSSNANYTISYVTGTLTVTPAALTVTAANKTRTYGAANPAFTANVAGFVNGDTAASLGGTLTVSTTATTSSVVGTYAITPAGLTSTNYTISYVNGTLTVTSAVLTITANDQTKAYGAANPALTVSYSGFVNGDTAASLTTPPTVTTTATTASGVGTYPITASGAVSSNANYTISYVTGTLTVTPAALTVTAANKTRTYGAANPAFTANVAGFVNGDTAASLGGTLTVSTTATTSSVVGTYAITPAGLTSTNYTISYVNGTLTVTSAVLTITANDQTKAYGAANPALTVSYSGFVNGDTAASLTTPPTVTTTATTASGVGTYPITASGAVSANTNYTITYASGTLTVTPAALTVTASNKTRSYGAANPAFTANFAGFLNGDTGASLGGTLTFTTTATASSAVGSYAITPSGLTASNYAIAYADGTLTVTPTSLTVTATNKTRTYGAANPTFTASVAGFVNGDTAGSLGGTLVVNTAATANSAVGTYPITPSGLTSTNYTINYVNGTLTVTSAVLTVTANDQTKAYGAANPALTVSYNGFVNGDTAASLTTPPTVTTTATTASGVGPYPITASGAASANANYTITYASGTLTVTPAALTVTAASKTRTYGAANPAFTANVAGFVNGDTAASLGGTLTFSTTATASSVVGTYAITPSGLTSTNYAINYYNATLTVTAAVLTITADDQTRAYGALNPALTVSYSGFVNGDTAASLTTPPTVTTTATTASSVGTYPITASGAVSSNANYTISYVTGTLTVTPAALTVTAASKTRTYGAANPAFTANVAGFVNGDTAASLGGTLTFSTTTTTSSVVGTYAITPAGLTSSNYTISYVNGTLTVTSAVLTITANDQTRAYGALNPALTVSYSGFVNGDTAASLTTPPTVTTTATTASGVGTYPITASGAASANANYTITYASGMLTVTPAALTVTAANKTRTYGAANPAFTANVAGFVNGDTAASLGGTLTFSTTATASSVVGTYAIAPSGLTSTNYTISYVNGTLTVTSAVLTISANDQTKAYGVANPALTVSYSGFVNGDTAASLTTPPTVTTTATTASGVGPYPITASGAVSANANYTITYASGMLTVTPAALTVTAANKTRTYGAANPAFTASVAGFVNGDTAASLGGTLTFSTTATASSAVGTYAITPAGLTSSNYTISYVNGTLTVTSAVLTITANDQTRAYGALNPALTVSYSGFVNGDTAASLTTQPTIITTATTASGIGTYPITASGAASANANYTITYASGTLTVTPVSLTVTATNKTRTYGAANPAFAANFAGFVNGDSAASLGGTLTFTTTATANSAVGTYAITPGGVTSTNYTIGFVNGTLTITSAALTITANDKTKTYGAANPALTVSYSGFVNGDTAASLTTPPTVTTTATTASGVGTYPIAASGASSSNYTIGYINGSLLVTQAPLTITATNQTKAAGTPNPPLTVTYSGFVNGDTAADLTTPPTVTTAATTSSPAGTYPITVSGAASPDYTIAYVNGTLTITGGGGGGGGPVANDNTYATTKGTSLIITAPGVLGNDTGGAQTAVLVSGPSHGTLTLNSSGSFRYTPSPTYVGTDTFRYQARDSSGNLSNVATVTISITQFSAALAPAPIAPAAAVMIAANDSARPQFSTLFLTPATRVLTF